MRRLAAGASVALLLVGGSAFAQAAGPGPPDVVVILADDLGYGDLGCYGGHLPTPVLDRIAAEGVRFTDAHAPASVCSPSRFGILTGRYAWRDGLLLPLRSSDPLAIAPGVPTLPGFLQERGYATACFGKWHLGLSADSGRAVPEGPQDVGFDTYFGAQVRWSGMNREWMRGREWIDLGDDGAAAFPDGTGPERLDVARPEETSRALLDQITGFLQESEGRPIFLFVALFQVHKPWIPPAAFRGRSGIGAYGDVILEMDWLVGEVQSRLRDGGRDNVLLFFTSDNGASTVDWSGHRPNGSFRGRKGQIWEGGHRVPLLACWPGRIPSGREISATVAATDLFPSVAAALEAELPTGAAIDGVNLLPWLLGGRSDSPIRTATVHVAGNGRQWALREGPWKLVQSKLESPRLFNLDSDPGETEDVAASHADLVGSLSERLEEYRRGRPTVNR